MLGSTGTVVATSVSFRTRVLYKKTKQIRDKRECHLIGVS